jgi:UDP-glucose 4-epimerase
MDIKNILVTGGAGFIGRAVVARCIAEGHRTTVIDNLCAGRLENLSTLLSAIEFHQADILDAARLEVIMSEAQPDVIFHLAAHHFIPFCDAHPQETLRVNVEGTHHVLSSAVRHGATVALVASTGAIYPSRNSLLDEEITPDPIDIYGLSKLMSEEVTRFVALTSSMKCVAARLFNTYGAYETNPHLIPHIIQCIQNRGPITLGNIHTRRDYVYVDDVADLLLGCATKASDSYTVVNIGTGEEYSAQDIVQTIGELLGRELAIAIDADRVRKVDKLHQRADTRRLIELTGMHPRFFVADGLRRLLAHESWLSDYMTQGKASQDTK